MADPAETAGPRRGRNRFSLALGLSLAVNVLLLGLIGGAVLGHRSGVGRDHAVTMMALGPYGRALADTDRAAIRKALRAEAPRFREERREVRQGFRDMLTALRGETFDADRIAAVLDRQEARVQAHAGMVRKLMLDRLSAMSPDERSAFADRLERVLRHGPPGRNRCEAPPHAR
ncbi:periplasmic heavy metal sensor [Rhodovulum sulfidophilum]|uniref:periplasmic heavy metal sensor n=1 Tax=Rhodovulum sulfidophilum TaxID=35806 RepID=UPI0005A6B56B|nr:periplasmic heavy metal sensor [Rhodovulum sulfidophilum]ANB34329.1 hypothetical protein A6W98_09715 [Rhodovulum sulfidophilum DSM 1374]ANB38151.1 hypothetical protein A6024_09575 [Rhodovulum sulfidophilum]MBL3552827.1 periplasmic heavy metal sensor [Rhodovulum sulfidophilum]MCW2301918.1 putative membrane protein [Rhodovulum sulfidophilum]OLS48232.1 hypothetical protein BV379_08000 [Rhodovulum sulfidophilum]